VDTNAAVSACQFKQFKASGKTTPLILATWEAHTGSLRPAWEKKFTRPQLKGKELSVMLNACHPRWRIAIQAGLGKVTRTKMAGGMSGSSAKR
jgi:hypothetical protein